MKWEDAAAGRRCLLDELRAARASCEISTGELASFLGAGWNEESVERVLTRHEELTAERFCALWEALFFLNQDRAFGLRRGVAGRAAAQEGGAARHAAHDARPLHVSPPDPERSSVPDPPEKIVTDLRNLLEKLCETDLPLLKRISKAAGGGLRATIEDILARKS